MARAPSRSRLTCTLTGAEVDGEGIRVDYAPIRGHPSQIDDWMAFLPVGEPVAIQGVGRFLRILRAGRVPTPADPYGLWTDLGRAAELVQRCRGTRVLLSLRRRLDRELTLWTEDGIRRISDVVDFVEDGDQLIVRRRHGQPWIYVPRHTVVRYEAATSHRLDVESLEGSNG